MPRWLRKVETTIAYWHARAVYRRFQRELRDVRTTQANALRRVLRVVAGSDYGRKFELERVATPTDFRRAAPLVTYEDIRPTIEQVMAGRTEALFARGTQVHMFATSSGTTARSKFIPVTSEFIRDYRRGWNTFGLKVLMDHRGAFGRNILQVTGRHDENRAPGGLPCGAITGMLARLQKPIVRKYYVGVPEIVRIPNSTARYYALMRCGIQHDLGFAITANPATLIRLARIADGAGEEIIRDVHDGTLSRQMVGDDALRKAIEQRLRPAPERARELAELRRSRGRLAPADYWKVGFLACWTGGSMSHYLPLVREWWGPVPIRDIGLLASEGRVTVPLNDEAPQGVLDAAGAFFEFMPIEECDADRPSTRLAHELEIGCDYAIVLTNTAGLIRYRLDDVVRIRGFIGTAPILEFLYRAGRVSSVAGEKLTENQVVQAVEAVRQELGLPPFDFALAPRWADPPWYRLTVSREIPNLSEKIDQKLCELNEEYASKRKSFRLGILQSTVVSEQVFAAFDRQQLSARGSTPEQFKRAYLFHQVDGDARLHQNSV